MKTPKSLAEILALDGTEFGIAFYDYLTDKKNTGASLSSVEEEAWLLLSMLLDIEMEGFADLFYQFYSLRECAIVEGGLEKLGLQDLAHLFNEAKAVYTDGRTDLTEEEYRQIDFTAFGQDRGRRFDELGKEIVAEGSEIYLIAERVERYVKKELHGRP